MRIYKRIALLLLMPIYVLALLVSCAGDDTNGTASGDAATPGADGMTPGSASFTEISYARPDTAALCIELFRTAELIRNGSSDSTALVEAVTNAEKAYSGFLTMHSYAELMHRKDSSDAFYASEYKFLKEAYSGVFVAKERLAHEIALSEHKDKLIGLGFDDSASFRIDDPSRISEEYFTLLNMEEKLKYSFSTLSENNVYITYEATTDTYTGTINRLKESLGEDTQSFILASDECRQLYEKAMIDKKLDVFLAIVKVRGLIADSVGYDSYNDYASAIMGHGYTADEYKKYIESVLEYMIPVYNDLNAKIFNPYFNNNTPKFLDRSTLLSNTLSLYESIDKDLYDALSAMISSELYDIETVSSKRSEQSYIAYFQSKQTPFLFHTGFADARDYLGLAHGFGNYLDILFNGSPSLTRFDAEFSSKLLAMITLSAISEKLDTDAGKLIYYYSMKSAMSEMVRSGFLSLAEHEIYNMSPDELNKDSVVAMMQKIAKNSSGPKPDISDIVTDELVLTPKALLGKTISAFFATEIYFSEGDMNFKLQIYKSLLERSEDKTPESVLSSFGISSPFEDGAVMELSDKIFYGINGYHYYRNDPAEIPVA